MIGMDEFRHTVPENMVEQRKEMLWPVLLSGGNIEWILDITTDVEDFRPFDDLWRWSGIARAFMEDNIPYWEMETDDDLLSGESGKGEVFLIDPAP